MGTPARTAPKVKSASHRTAPPSEFIERWTRLPDLERDAIELIDLSGLTPKQAALTLGSSPGAMRVRLFRARACLRKEQDGDG
jgi:RNA polymerase sigma-70 factor (ECF subfamily)